MSETNTLLHGKDGDKYSAISIEEVPAPSKKGFNVGFAGTDLKLMKAIFITLLIYSIVSIVAFSYVFEQWTIIDSLYFMTVTLTTVGYGDLWPTTDAGKLFAILYVIPGVIAIGVGLGMIGDSIIVANEAAVESAKKSSKKGVVSLFLSDDSVEEEEEEEKELSIWGAFVAAIAERSLLIIFLLVSFIAFGIYEKWTVVESLYFLVITGTTCGYGDMAPDTQLGRLLAIFFLPVIVGLVGEMLGSVSVYYMSLQAQAAEERFLERQLTLEDISAMDTDGDKDVDMFEFVSFMLVAMQKVEKSDIDEIVAVFKKMDVDGSGELDKNDLLALTQVNKTKRKHKKLEKVMSKRISS